MTLLTSSIIFLFLLLYIRNLKKKNKKYEEALEFYADPATYFAIGFLPDGPCGEFADDFDQTPIGYKPGKKARTALDNNIIELR